MPPKPGITAAEMLKQGLPNCRVVTDPIYGVQSTSNPQGLAGGNLMQLIADEVEGQSAGFCAFSEKMRAHAIVRDVSSFRQKVTGGSWGAVIRQPWGIAQMLGI